MNQHEKLLKNYTIGKHVDINQLKIVFLPTPTPTKSITVILKKSVIALPLPTVTHLTILSSYIFLSVVNRKNVELFKFTFLKRQHTSKLSHLKNVTFQNKKCYFLKRERA